MFDDVAQKNKFTKSFGGWFCQTDECIIVLDMQKSNFSNQFLLNIKIYIQGIFGNTYTPDKNLVKKDIGDVFRRQPNEFNDVFDFENALTDSKRKERMEELFNSFIVPFLNKALFKKGILELYKNGDVFLLPAIEKYLKSDNNMNSNEL
jgi:hypothetical protein